MSDTDAPHPCPRCGYVRKARAADNLCSDCAVTQIGRTSAGNGAAPIDEYTIREMRAALNELHATYGWPAGEVAA